MTQVELIKHKERIYLHTTQISLDYNDIMSC